MKNGILFRKFLMAAAVILLLFLSNIMFAQSCNWQDATIGSNATGTASYSICDPVTATITATAYTASTTADEQNFVYRELCGDGELITQLTGLNPTSGYYGIEFRANLAAGAMKFGLKKNGTGFTLTKISRSATNAAASNLSVNDFNGTWSKIVRSGDVFTSYTSFDGSNWFQKQTATIVMPECIVGGMLVSGIDAATAVSGSFDGISFSGDEDGDNSTIGQFYCGYAPTILAVSEQGDAFFSDRFGNNYTYEQVRIKQKDTNGDASRSFPGCGCGDIMGVDVNGMSVNLGDGNYFDVWFEDCDLETGTGFDAPPPLGVDRRKVLCQVFYDLAHLIKSNNNECADELTVAVQVMPSELGSADEYYGLELPPFPESDLGNVLGYATAYHYFQTRGIVHGLPWVVINTGENVNEDSYDGIVRINFNEDIDWNLNYASTSFSEIDLYTACYHEALHMLDFAGAISSTGRSIWQPNHPEGLGGYYGFTRNLVIEDGNSNDADDLHMIINNPNPSLDWFINPALDFSAFSACNENDVTFSPELVFQGTGQHYPVYTGNQYQTGSSFSHLEIDCITEDVDAQYIMHPSIGSGAANSRRITDAEKDILKIIGYTLYEEGNDGCSVAGVADEGPYFTDVDDMEGDCNSELLYSIALQCDPENPSDLIPTSINIFIRDLIYNDGEGVDNVAFLQPLNTGDGYVTGPVSIGGYMAYQFFPSRFGQLSLVYVPIGCGDEEGNVTFVKVRAFPDEGCAGFCEEFTPCEEFTDDENCIELLTCEEGLNPNCNLICNPRLCGSFRPLTLNSLPFRTMGVLYNYTNYLKLPGWTSTHGSPDYVLDEEDMGTGKIHIGATHGILCDVNGVGTSIWSEGVQTFVNIYENTQYLLGFETGNDQMYSLENQLNSNISVRLLEGQELTFNTQSQMHRCPVYTGIEEISVIDFHVSTPNLEIQRVGACFLATNNAYNALWFYIDPASIVSGRAGLRLDNVELIEDVFTAGGEEGVINSPVCGALVSLGQDFCMLTGVGVTYEWFEVGEDENGGESLSSLVRYNVKDGNVSGINPPNAPVFDPNTRVLTINPFSTTTYRLVRTIFNLGGLQDDFEFCETEDDVVIQVPEDIPDADFTFTNEDCIYTFTPSNYTGQIATWYIDGVEVNPDFFNDGVLIIVLSNGVHIITLTLTNICNQQSESEQAITVDCPCPAPVISFSITDLTCGTYQFIPQNDDATYIIITWTWDYGQGNDVVNSEIGMDTYSPGSYEVCLTATNDCGESAMICEPLTVDEYLPSLSGISYEQDPNQPCIYIFTTTAPQLVDTYAWDFDGDGMTDATTNPAMYQFDEAGLVTVSLAVSNDCGDETVSIDLEVEECIEPVAITCPCEDIMGNYNLALPASGKTLSSLIASGDLPDDPSTNEIDLNLDLVGNCMAISGKLIIDVSCYIGNGQIKMQNQSEILVKEGVGLTLRNVNEGNGTHRGIYGCIELWQGITIEKNASFLSTGCVIQDAHRAVRPLSGAIIAVQGTVFERNVIGINHQGLGFELLFCDGNTFDGSGDLLPVIDDVFIAERPLVGVSIRSNYYEQSVYHIGNTENNPNVFVDILNGIHTYGGLNLIVDNTRFENIQEDLLVDDMSGFGIFMVSAHSLTQRGFGKSSSSTVSFDNCTTAIRSEFSGDIDIKNNNMQAVGTGIYVQNSQNRIIDIISNYIETTAQGSGIKLLHNDPALHLNVIYNDIDLGHKSRGIVVEEMGNPHTEAIIGVNTINGAINTIFNQGIFMQNTNNIGVAGNIIYTNTTGGLIGVSNGIAIKNGQNCLFSCNKVYGNGGDVTGLDVWGTLATQYNCNDFTNLHTGMKFTGICNINETTTLKGNDFFPPFEVGLHYTITAEVNGQAHKGNRWHGGTSDYSDVAARHDGGQLFILEAQYAVHTTSPPFHPPSINPTAVLAQWFLPDPTGTPESCIGNPQDPGDDDCPIYYIVDPKIDDLAKRAAKGQAVGSIYPATALWTAQKALHQNIKENPNLLGEDVFVDMFYTTAENNKMGALNAIEHNISTAWTSLTTELEQIQSLSKQLSLNIANLIEKDELIAQASTPTLLTERDNLLQSIHTQSESITTLYTAINTFRDSEAIVLKNDNTGILSTTIYENNEKAVNDIYLGTILLDNADFTAAQKAILFSIAEQCPLEGGNAVFKARALYVLVEDMEYDDDVLCGSQALVQAVTNKGIEEINESGKVERKTLEAFHLYPNPAKDMLTLEYHLAKEAQLAIFDLYGRKVMQKTLSPDNVNIQINTQQITNGIYLLKISDTDNEYFFSKVIIQH